MARDPPGRWRPAAAGLVLGLGGCAGVQSAFTPFGAEAAATLALGWGMWIAAALIAAGVLALAHHAWHAPEGWLDLKRGMRMILWLGAIGPAVLLGLLLLISLPQMKPLPASAADLRIAVEGEQYWWRVRYAPAGGQAVESANEVRLPVGRAVTFTLSSPDVIHSFWIPGLAGKVDMIPGRTNSLTVRATQAGTYRGVCAEFCGLSHAHMAFDVVAMPAADFDRWLTRAARPVPHVSAPGRLLFGDYGCSGCHVIRGHFDGSAIGPDLTRMGARRSLAAGTLPMSETAIAAFIRDPATHKPGALMPSFRAMPDEDARAIAAYLGSLR